MNNPETQTKTETAKKPKNFKKVKYGSMSIAVMVLVIVLVVILNLIAGYASKRAPLKIDLTADNRYELSDESIDFLRNKLDKDVEVIITCPKAEFEELSASAEFFYLYNYGIKLDCPYDMIPVLLEKYEMYANQGKGKLSVRYVDLDKDPKAVQKYKESFGGEIEAQSIILSCGDRVRVIDTAAVSNMIAPDTSNQTNINLIFAGESTITSEIMNVTDANPVRVAFASAFNGQAIYTQNYSDAAPALRDRLLVKNGYICTDIDIAKDELSVDKYDMVVIPMPSNDFDETTIKKLSDFLYNGGNYGKNMLFIADTLASDFPNISEFLAEWNLAVSTGTVLQDEESYMGNNTFALQAKVPENDFTANVPQNSLYLVAPTAQEVQILSRNVDGFTEPVIQTSGSAVNFDMNTEKTVGEKGVKNIAAIATKRTQISNFEYSDSNVMVLGCGLMTRSDVIVQSNLYSNASTLLSILNTMTGRETDSVIIPEKTLQAATIAPTANQDKTIKIVVIFVIPAVIAVIGLAVLLRRRNR